MIVTALAPENLVAQQIEGSEMTTADTLFSRYDEKSEAEQANITRREADRQAGILAATDFIRSDEHIRQRAIDLTLRSADLNNDQWTDELSQDWRIFRQDVINRFSSETPKVGFLSGDRTTEETSSYFEYGLQFVLSDLKNGEFSFDEGQMGGSE